jgi:hypothetical protein
MLPVIVGFAITSLLFGLLAWYLSTPRQRRPQRPDNPPPPPEHLVGGQRQAFRYSKHSVRIFLRKGEEEQLGEGWIIDHSTGGLGLLLVNPGTVWSTGPVAERDILEIKPTNVPVDCPWARVEIRHINEQADYWLAGGRLLDDLPAEVLPIFGYVAPRKMEGPVDVLERRNWSGPTHQRAAT